MRSSWFDSNQQSPIHFARLTAPFALVLATESLHGKRKRRAEPAARARTIFASLVIAAAWMSITYPNAQAFSESRRRSKRKGITASRGASNHPGPQSLILSHAAPRTALRGRAGSTDSLTLTLAFWRARTPPSRCAPEYKASYTGSAPPCRCPWRSGRGVSGGQ